MDATELRNSLSESAEEVAASVRSFATALTDRHVRITSCLHLSYSAVGEPYGPGDDAAWQWYKEEALAFHLSRIAERIRGQHSTLAEARAMLERSNARANG